mgnify:CR=1 FL=1
MLVSVCNASVDEKVRVLARTTIELRLEEAVQLLTKQVGIMQAYADVQSKVCVLICSLPAWFIGLLTFPIHR